MVLPILTFVFTEIQEWFLENRVKSYLIEERGYNSEDIQQITTKSKKHVTEAIVVFVSEPEVQYHYHFLSGDIRQMGYGLVQGFSKQLDHQNLEHLE